MLMCVACWAMNCTTYSRHKMPCMMWAACPLCDFVSVWEPIVYQAHSNQCMPFWLALRIFSFDHSILLDSHKNCSMLLFEKIGALETRFFHYQRLVKVDQCFLSCLWAQNKLQHILYITHCNRDKTLACVQWRLHTCNCDWTLLQSHKPTSVFIQCTVYS